MSKFRKFIDIGANLTDLMYTGVYNGSLKHEPDLKYVLNRSWDAGLEKIIVTGGNADESKKALEIAKLDDRLYATVGCHPTRCNEFLEKTNSPDEYLDQLRNIIHEGKNKIVAMGECGLDYFRVEFCSKEAQKKYFELQLKLNEEFKLPLFLHCRDSAQDLYEILSRYDFKGVVHSFDGTLGEAEKFIDLGYYIGLNGCSLKTNENLEVIAKLPVEKIVVETDCPWCEIRPSHTGFKFVRKENQLAGVKKEKWSPNSMVKGRNEPNNIRQVLDVIASVKNEDLDTLSEEIFKNTLSLFFK